MTGRSLPEQAGHDRGAMRLLGELQHRYRREGLPGLRAAVEHLTGGALPRDEVAALLVEAVLTGAERASRPGRRAWEDFDLDEQHREGDEIRRGGGA